MSAQTIEVFERLRKRVDEIRSEDVANANKTYMTNMEFVSTIEVLKAEIGDMENSLGQMHSMLLQQTQATDQVYVERNRLVSFISKIFPSCIIKHQAMEGEDWDPEWLNIICVDTPKGQMTWHVHDSEIAPLFSHLEVDEDIKWDGHTTDEKYGRLAKLTLEDI